MYACAAARLSGWLCAPYIGRPIRGPAELMCLYCRFVHTRVCICWVVMSCCHCGRKRREDIQRKTTTKRKTTLCRVCMLIFTMCWCLAVVSIHTPPPAVLSVFLLVVACLRLWCYLLVYGTHVRSATCADCLCAARPFAPWLAGCWLVGSVRLVGRADRGWGRRSGDVSIIMW